MSAPRGTSVATERPHYALDWLRILAALSVVATHSKANQVLTTANPTAADLALSAVLLSFATVAVIFFFVLGAFLSWGSIVKSTMTDRPVAPWHLQVVHRLIRLYPLYFVLVVVVWAFSNTEVPGHWQDLLLHLSLTHVFSNEYIFWTLGPGWYLAVDLFFATILALVGAATVPLARRCRDPRTRLAVLAAPGLVIAAGGAGFLVWAVDHVPADAWAVWFGVPGFILCVGAGMTLAVVAASGITLPWPVRGMLVAAAVATIFYAAAQFTNQGNILWRLPLTLAGMALIASVTLTRRAPLRILTWGPVVWLGGLSFSIYLVHEPILRMARYYLPLPSEGTWSFLWTYAVVLAISIPAAWLAQRWIELPATRLAYHFDRGPKAREYYAHLSDETTVPERRVITVG